MKKIIISAYACSQLDGSEFFVSWNYINELSKDYKVILNYGTDNDKLIGSINLHKKIIKNIKFNFIKANSKFKIYHFIAIKCGITWFWPIALREWNKLSYENSYKLVLSDEDIVAAHQLGPIGFKNAGYLWKLPIPTYWGPIGGLLKINPITSKSQGLKIYLFTRLWNILNMLSLNSGYIKRAANGFTAICFATEECRDLFQAKYNRLGPVISEVSTIKNGTTKNHHINNSSSNNKLKIIWVGSLIWRKNVYQLLDSLELVKDKEIDFQVLIFGDGPFISKAKKKSEIFKNTNINIKFMGKVNRSEVINSYKTATCIIFNSLSEANSVALFEAISFGVVPIVPYAHGFKTTLDTKCAFFYKFSDPYKQQCQAIADSIIKLSNSNTLHHMKKDLLKINKNMTIDKILDRHKENFYDHL